ncbi:MAG: hypothetical protein WC149_01745 [Arcobacteraceae bacterium]
MNFKKINELLYNSNRDEQLNIEENENTLQALMKYKGYYFGFSGHSSDFIDTLENLTSKFKAPQGIFIKFVINQNIDASALENVMETIHKFIPQTTTLVFDTDINNTINLDEFQFQILLTGIQE